MAWESLHTEKEISLSHLGITATHVRKIKSGTEYEQYFEKPIGTTDVINEEASVHDTLAHIGVLVNKTLNETKKIAQVLKRPTLNETCESIFNFFYQHYQYKLDEAGVEQVRTPLRAWADRKTGIDCDCFATSVSSILTNLGIEHYLKIIAINGRPNYQHIYVVVPKQQGLDINTRSNYWVIDPVLNHYNEEAPNITKKDYLKMNGIPLHQLNGIDDYAGLGNEFEGIDDELSGADDETVGRAFHRRLREHVTNTRKHIQRKPRSVSHVYKPHVLVRQLEKLEAAFDGTEEHLDGVLEELSNIEHEAIQEKFAGVYDAIHGHDDHLYGHMFGNIDDEMLGTVLGLGRKGRSKEKVKSGNKGKKGFFTKIKNARKGAKSNKFKGKLKKFVKKAGHLIKKGNPVSVAARGGFLVAMRTNFAKLAEKAYWGLQTPDFAASKGIKSDYYKSCVTLWEKLQKVFVDKLAGKESAIRKAILNGRAAKKIAKLLKKKGMSGTTEELFGFGGLGVVEETTVVAAMAFLTPIITLSAKMFKGKKSGLEDSGGRKKKKKDGSNVEDTIENENGTESPAPSDDADVEIADTITEARNPSNTTIDNDGSIEAADSANDEDSTDDETVKKKDNTVIEKDATNDTALVKTAETTETTDSKTPDTKKKGGNTGVIIGVSAAALIALALIAKSKKKVAVDGLGNFSKKRESKRLKEKLKKQGVKMPHGYDVEKRKVKKVETIKL